MSNEVTIDELRIEIKAESGTAASNIDKLAQSLDRLQAVTQRMTGGGDGLNKVAKQIEKLSAISQKIQSMRGFEKLAQVVEQLKKLDGLNSIGDISGFVRNLNKLPQAVNALAQMPSIDATKFQQIADALKPLETVSAGNINSLLNSLRKLPKVSQELAGVDLTRFASQIQQISTAIEPLTRQAERGGAGLTALAQIMQQTSRQARQSSSGVSLFNQTIGNIKVKTLAAIAGLRRLFSALKSGVTASAAYVENLNLFSVTMGESAGEALKFAEAVNSALGVDTSDWIRYQGVFQSIGKGFGIVSEKADVMSKNLTQLTYDISSFYNISADTAAEKLQSALSGQVMPMRQLGFAIEETTLKQVALNHGIEASVENMTQAQKAQLRYVAIMEQAGNIGVLGDMARTIDTAANGMRVLQARLQQFARAIGNMVMPVLSAVLPYATAFVQILTEGAQAIADFFGFELPKIDFSGAAVSSGFDDITSSVDAATEANEKFKGSLSSIDQLNIIGSKDEGKGSGGNENQFDLGIKLPEYDFLQGIESKTKEIAENIKNWFKEALPWIGAVGTAIAGVFIVSKINDFIGFLGKVKESISTIGGMISGKFGKSAKIFSGIAGGLAAGASSGILFYNSIKNLITGTGKLGNNIAMLAGGVGIAGIAIAAFVKSGNPVGAVITGIGALAGVFIGIAQAQKELNNQLAESVVYADNGGIAIDGLAKGYENYFDNVTIGYDDILKTNTALEENANKIKIAADEVMNITDKYRNMNSVMAGEDAKTIKENIKEIGKLAKDWLGKETSDLINTLTEKFSKFAEQLGVDIGDLSGKLRLLQGMGESKIEQFQRQANDLVDALASGKLHGEDFRNALNELDEITKKLSIPEVTAESISFTKALEEMQSAAINFSDTEAIEAMKTLGEKADAARSKLDEAKLSQLANLQSMRDYYTQLKVDVDFDAKMKAEGIDLTFKDLFDQIETALETGYKTELNKIDVGEAVFYAQIQGQLDTFSDDYVWKKTKDVAEAQGLSREEAMRKLKEAIAPFGGSMYDMGIAEFMETDTMKTLQETIDNGFNKLKFEDAIEAGKMITEGLANGTINGQDGLNNALNTVAIDGLDALETAFDINSPSKKTEEIGNYLMQGLDIGIMNGLPDVLKTLDNVSAAIFDKMKGLPISLPGFNVENTIGNMDMNAIYERVKKETASFCGSYTLPRGSAVIGGAVGAAREAYSNAAQSAVIANNGQTIDAHFTVQSYVELDGEQVGHAAAEYNQQQMAYSNGR